MLPFEFPFHLCAVLSTSGGRAWCSGAAWQSLVPALLRDRPWVSKLHQGAEAGIHFSKMSPKMSTSGWREGVWCFLGQER